MQQIENVQNKIENKLSTFGQRKINRKTETFTEVYKHTGFAVELNWFEYGPSVAFLTSLMFNQEYDEILKT